eukprot:5462460-Prymnesium_polylepis.1
MVELLTPGQAGMSAEAWRERRPNVELTMHFPTCGLTTLCYHTDTPSAPPLPVTHRYLLPGVSRTRPEYQSAGTAS